MSQPDQMTCPYSDSGGDRSAAVAHTLHDYREAEEVFRSPKMTAFLHDGTEEFRGGTVRQIDGTAHRVRRRTLGLLLRGRGEERFRQEVLLPTIERNLARVLESADGDELPGTDMVLFARVAFFQLVAALIGLDGVDTTEDAEKLREFAEPIQVAMRSWYMGGDRTAVMARGMEVRDAFRGQYFQPALERRRQLVSASGAGSEGEADAPKDFLTLVAQGLDPDLSGDLSLALREAVTDFINAGTFSSSFTLVHALDECLTWFEQYPDDRSLSTDGGFLAKAVAEALRLHPIVPLFYRTASERVTLKSGRVIEEGDHVCVEIGAANRDESVFGPDANSFVPGRSIPSGVYPYGLAFGTGRHMCYGVPVITGSDGLNGSHVQILKALFAAGVMRDPASPPRMNTDFGRMDGLWDVYPVRFHGGAKVVG